MSKESTFLIFCMENYKAHKNLSGKEVAGLFEKYNVYDYIYSGYNVLHTTGSQYINADIDEYLRLRGA